jgi:hypothetical protein
VPTSIIKATPIVFGEIIARLANLSFTQGTFPTKFKFAAVTPLLKKPSLDPDVSSNYRPISNLNNISKILEKLFLSRFYPHVISSQLFNPYQSAYRKFYSTETSLTRLLDSIYHAADSGSATLLLALDLSAAFDTIDHQTLLNRLRTSFGITGLVFSWLSSYLSDRSFAVVTGSSSSLTCSCNTGVPQGSVLGPILFSLYTSPIHSIVSQYAVRQQQYADDTQLFISITSTNHSANIEQLQSCFSTLQGWFLYNGLALNPDKTEAICFGTPGRRKSLSYLTSVQLSDVSVNLSDHIKLLGVSLDSSLSFDSHVSNTCSSSYFHIRALRRIRPFMDLDTSNTIACSIVGSRLDYSNCIFSGIPSKNIHRLQRVQNTLARVVVSNNTASSTAALRSLHWLPIQQRVSFKLSCLVYRSLHGTAPAYLSGLLTSYIPTRSLRSSDLDLLSVPRCNTAFGSRGFRSAGPRLWNSLPHNIRTTDSYSSFRSHLKTHLFSTAFDASGH